MKKEKMLQIISLIIVSSVFMISFGCASFPTPHENSFYNKDEDVTVKMLTLADVRENYKADWEASFKQIGITLPGASKGDKIAPAIIAPFVIGLAAPVVFDYVKKKLQEEAENYVQQFGVTYFDNKFWLLSGKGKPKQYKQNYYGFEIIRKAKRYNDDGTKKEKEAAFKLVYGIAEDKDGIFWVAPLYFQTTKSKAKVLADTGKHKITTKVELSFDSVWISGAKKYHKENIAKFDRLLIPNYDIESNKILRSSCNIKNPPDETCPPLKGNLNSFGGIPISSGSSEEYAGKFWLSVLVTESDTAKTKEHIGDLADFLDKNRDKIIDFVKKQIP